MKILITGAHFTPAVAVIGELKKMDPGIKIVYVGRGTTQEGDQTKSVESKVLPNLGIKFIPIIAGRLQRSFSIYTIPSLLKIPVGFIQAVYILLSEKPDIILSFGGYVALPLVIVGWLYSIPIIIHEQTLVSGLANKISAVFADKIAVSFKESSFKGDKVILTGNPIRSEIIQISQGVSRLPNILIMGGNQGSHLINLATENILQKLLKIIKVYHQTGDSKYKDYERLEGLLKSKKLEDRYIVKKWFDQDYAKVLQQTDLVVSRAGINTLIELAYLGKPALVIPIPYLYNDEQNKNARFFENLGLVKILPQSKLDGKTLLINIKSMLKDIRNLKVKVEAARKIIIQDAAKRLALETLLLKDLR